jgi:hypothetical protein
MAAKAAPPVPPLASIIKAPGMQAKRPMSTDTGVGVGVGGAGVGVGLGSGQTSGHSSIDSLCAAAIAVSAAQEGSSFSAPNGGSLMDGDTMLLSGRQLSGTHHYKDYKDKYDMLFAPTSSGGGVGGMSSSSMLLPESQLAAAMAAERFSGGSSGAEQFSVFMRSFPSIKSIPSLNFGGASSSSIGGGGASIDFAGSSMMMPPLLKQELHELQR